MEHVALKDTGHALHHSHSERIAGLIAAFSRRLMVSVRREARSAQTQERAQIDENIGPG
jgi:hypothetical protein